LISAHARLVDGIGALRVRADSEGADQRLVECHRRIATGHLPEAGSEDRSAGYQGVLSWEAVPLVRLDVVLYRGPGLEPGPAGQLPGLASGLMDRLSQSDSIHVVVEASKVMRGLAGQVLQRVDEIFTAVLDQPRPDGDRPPSLVVILTKADRVLPATESVDDCWERVQRLADGLMARLPVARHPDARVLGCPVASLDGRCQRPLWVQRPLLFAVLDRVLNHREVRRLARQRAEADHRELSRRALQLTMSDPAGAWKASRAAEGATNAIHSLDQELTALRDWVTVLGHGMGEGLPLFFGGRRFSGPLQAL
jgi:hypothetical protein